MLIPASISKNRKDGYIPISKYIQDKYGKQKGNLSRLPPIGNSQSNFRRHGVLLKRLEHGSDVAKVGFIFGTSINYFNQKFQVVKKELKLGKDYTLYSIKHTRAVHLAKDGASPYAIQQLFRHHSLEMTSRYLRDLGLSINRDAVEKGIRF